MQKNKPTVLGTTLGLGGLVGILPFLITFLIARYALEHGGRAWPDPVFEVTFTVLYIVMVGLGGWAFARIFGG